MKDINFNPYNVEYIESVGTYRKFKSGKYFIYIHPGCSNQHSVIDSETSKDISNTVHGLRLIIDAMNLYNNKHRELEDDE